MLLEFIFLILIDLIINKVPAYTVLPNWKRYSCFQHGA